MKITINGSNAEVTTGLTISDLLIEQKVKMPDMVSVELNGEILDRHAFQTTTLKEGDKVEFLYFMGGGTALNRAQATPLAWQARILHGDVAHVGRPPWPTSGRLAADACS